MSCLNSDTSLKLEIIHNLQNISKFMVHAILFKCNIAVENKIWPI